MWSLCEAFAAFEAVLTVESGACWSDAITSVVQGVWKLEHVSESLNGHLKWEAFRV